MTLSKDHTTGRERHVGHETHGESRKGVAERTVLGGGYNDSGSVDGELRKAAAGLNSGRGSKRGLPAR